MKAPETLMSDDLQLTNAEKDLIRREFMTRFGEAQSVKQGFHLKRWATGPLKGTPKLVAAVQGMLGRNLITVIDEGHWPRAMFTDKGLQALKRLATERRGLDPERHQALIDELSQITELSASGIGR